MTNDIVLDPGHGGSQARGNSSPDGERFGSGQTEKNINFTLARHVQQHLGGARLTRGAGENRALAERIETARSQAARAFVSLHTNPRAGSTVWIHPRANAESHRLAQSISRQLTPVWGAPVSVARGELAVLSPEHHHPDTAACLVDLGLRDESGLGTSGAAIAAGIRRLGSAHGVPSLNFGPPGPGGRPLGAICWTESPLHPPSLNTPGLVSWREFNDSDTAAGPYVTQLTIIDPNGQAVVDQAIPRAGLAAGGQLDGSWLLTPLLCGVYTARVRLNARNPPIAEDNTDDNTSETSATVICPRQLEPEPGVPLNQGYAGGRASSLLEATASDPGPSEPSTNDQVERELRAMLDGDRLIAAMLEDLEGRPLPSDEQGQEGGAYGQVPDPQTRNGTYGVLGRAIFLFPPINQRIRLLSDEAIQRFRSLSTCEEAILITWSVPFTAGLILGISREPRLWPLTQSVLNEGINAGLHRIVPDMNVQIDLVSPNKSFMVTFDLAPTLRRLGVNF